MTRMRSKAVALLGAAGLTVGLLGFVVAPALATQGDVHKVTICHATASHTNPYIHEEVDIASSGHDEGLPKAGHATHTGPIFEAGMAGKWGDIIPSYDYTNGSFHHHFDGLNWTAAGQAILNNGCVPPTPTNPPKDVVPSSSPSTAPSTAPSFTATQEAATVIPSEPNTSTIGAGSSGSSDSTWLIVAALGALLASVVVMTPTRARKRD